MMEINLPDILVEVTHAFQRYETALMENDLDALNALFWQSPLVIRFGPGQNLYGIEAIDAFRNARVGGSPKRTLAHTVITTFGRDFGTANTEFLRENTNVTGRQTQSWVRFAKGWHVVSAHVSFLGSGS